MIQYRDKDLFREKIPREFVQHAIIAKNKVHYHFANEIDAKNFLHFLQKKFWTQNIFAKTKVKRSRCKHSSQYQRCQEIEISTRQYEKIYGEYSHKNLYKVIHAPESNSSIISSILKNMSTEFSEELALMIPILDEKRCNYLARLHIGNDLLLMHYAFCDSLLPRLNLESIAKLKFENDQTQVLLAKLLKSTKLSTDTLQIFFTKLGVKICKEFVYLQNKVIFEYRDDILSLLLSNLNENELNRFVANLIDQDDIRAYGVHYLLINQPKLHPAIIAKLNYLRSNEHFFVNELKDSEKIACKLANSLFDYSDEIKSLRKKNSLLSLIEICDDGASTDSWNLHAAEIISLAPSVLNPKISLDFLNRFLEGEVKYLESKNIAEIVGDRFRFHTCNCTDFNALQVQLIDLKGNRLILRIQQKEEPISSLLHQYKTANYFKKNATKHELKSFFPDPIGVFQITGLFEWLEKNMPELDFKEIEISEMLTQSKKHGVYLSKVSYQNDFYNKFLYDVSLSAEDYKKVNRVIIHDLFTMLKEGVIFPTIALLLHHSHKPKEECSGYGRHLVLANLLLGKIAKGTGRLDHWEYAVSDFKTKLRASGIVDLHESISMNELIGYSPYLNQNYGDASSGYDQQAINYILANVMAEYQYILFLLAGMRGLALIREKINPPDVWLILAKQVVKNCAYASSLLTNKSERELEKIFSSLIDVDRLGRQMQYWMTGEYIEDIMENTMKADIYAPDTQVYVNFESFCLDSYNSDLGFTSDFIYSDLGNINGQEPIKEANKLFYFMVTQIFAYYSEFKLTLDDVRKITAVKDLKESEKLRKESFSHLYGKSYHAIQKNLCRERLQQREFIPEVMLTDIENERKYHAREEAAYKIGSFWRRYKKAIPETFEMKKNMGR